MHTARFAPGVIGQIMDGERPARVPDNVIDELKAGEHNGIIATPTTGRQSKLNSGTPIYASGRS